MKKAISSTQSNYVTRNLGVNFQTVNNVSLSGYKQNMFEQPGLFTKTPKPTPLEGICDEPAIIHDFQIIQRKNQFIETIFFTHIADIHDPEVYLSITRMGEVSYKRFLSLVEILIKAEKSFEFEIPIKIETLVEELNFTTQRALELYLNDLKAYRKIVFSHTWHNFEQKYDKRKLKIHKLKTIHSIKKGYMIADMHVDQSIYQFCNN